MTSGEVMVRHLDPSEVHYLDIGMWISYTTCVEGPLDFAAAVAAGAAAAVRLSDLGSSNLP